MLILIDADEISLKEILQSNLENYGKYDIGQKRRFFEKKGTKNFTSQYLF